MSTRVAVVADSHVEPGSRRDLPRLAWEEIAAADLVLHAGDVVTGGLLEQITELTPVVAVLGNNDRDLAHLADRWQGEVEGVRLAMVHDSGPTKGRAARMRRWFPDADLAVFGHSHAPVNEVGVDGQWLLNPGSPTLRRRQPVCTMARVTLDEGRFQTAIIELEAGPA